jgi:hypothetical protein
MLSALTFKNNANIDIAVYQSSNILHIAVQLAYLLHEIPEETSILEPTMSCFT